MMFSEFIELIDRNQAQNNGQNAPAAPPAPPSAIIGTALPRIDGPLKTTGTARYAADYNFPRMVYAVPVCATIASGTIKSLDISAAEKMPGVVLMLHHGNIGPLYRNVSGGRNSENRPPFEDENDLLLGPVCRPRRRRNLPAGPGRRRRRQGRLHALRLQRQRRPH